jgi:hypothetical protein
VGVDPAADEEPGPPEDLVAGETAELVVAGEAVVVGRTSMPAEYAPGGEEAMAGEASPPAGDAIVAVDAPAPAAGGVGGDVGSAPATGEAGSEVGRAPKAGETGGEDESTPAAELEPGGPIEAGGSPDGGRAVVLASGIVLSVVAAGVADIVVPALSMAFAAAAGLPAKVVAEAEAKAAVAVSGVGVEASDPELGDVAISQPAVPAPLVLAESPVARGAREGCATLS